MQLPSFLDKREAGGQLAYHRTAGRNPNGPEVFVCGGGGEYEVHQLWVQAYADKTAFRLWQGSMLDTWYVQGCTVRASGKVRWTAQAWL